ASSPRRARRCSALGCLLPPWGGPPPQGGRPSFGGGLCPPPGIFLMPTGGTGSIRSVSICTMTSVPPANTRAGPVAPASKATAACSVAGASYLRSVIKPPSLVSSLALSCLQFRIRPRPNTSQDLAPIRACTAARRRPRCLASCHLLPNNEIDENRSRHECAGRSRHLALSWRRDQDAHRADHPLVKPYDGAAVSSLPADGRGDPHRTRADDRPPQEADCPAAR